MSHRNQTKIKAIARRSQAGDFFASYQLYNYYSEGVIVPADNQLAEQYKALFASQFNNQPLKIKSIRLENYKGFDDIKIDFSTSKNTTVLVGNNGSGKSTVLDAIKKCMTHLSSRLSTRSFNGELIESDEIKKGTSFSNITLFYGIAELDFHMNIIQSTNSEIKSKYLDLNILAQMYKTANSINPDVSFPLLAAYTVERANDVTTKDIEHSDEIIDVQTWDKLRAYSKSLTGKADFKLFFRWLKELIEIENSDNSDIKSLKLEIRNREKDLDNPLLKALLAENNNSITASKLIEEQNSIIKNLKEKLNSYYTTNSKTLHIVQDAIYSFLPGFSDLVLQRAPLDLLIRKDDTSLSVLQLSQGEKSILALVADIARRLTLLNPSLDNPLDGAGIVLIDEVDLHLHPEWQQKIIKKLENTFKNIQFIVTTHSPQVCHTIDSSNIWLLRDGNKFRAPRGTRGAVSSWVLENLFFVNERPPEDKYTLLLKEYKNLVYSGQYDTPQAKQIGLDLSEHFGPDYDVLVELKLEIENREWEISFEKDQ